MKRLTVLRHAKSSWDDHNLDDFDRPLNDRGRKAAKRIGREFKERGFRFDLVIASPAARVRETIYGLEEKFEFGASMRFDERIYLAPLELLLSVVRDLPDDIEGPLLVGHNPGLEQLTLELTAGEGRERSSVEKGLPTAAVAVIDLPAKAWSRVEANSGTLKELILPRELD